MMGAWTVDRIHLTLVTLMWVAGIVTMLFSLARVNRNRRILYWLAIPIWVGFTVVYVDNLLGYIPPNPSWSSLILRVCLGGIALVGLLVPYFDRLDFRSANRVAVEVSPIKVELPPNV